MNQFEQIHPLVDRLFFSPKTSMTKIVTNQVLKISGVVVLSPIVLALIKTFVYKLRIFLDLQEIEGLPFKYNLNKLYQPS